MMVEIFFLGVVIYFIFVFIDNYIWCIYNESSVIVVDLGDVELVLVFIKVKGLMLSVVFIIYYYRDYIGGIVKLVFVVLDLLVIGLRGNYIRGIIKFVF